MRRAASRARSSWPQAGKDRINNIIIWPAIFELYRQRILQSNFMVVTGELQSMESVVHVVATEVEDYSHWVRTLPRKSRDFH